MVTLQITASLLGLSLAIVILLLVRRDHLHLSHGLFWLVVAVAAALLGIWPQFIDTLAVWAGVAYSPTLLMLVAVMVLFVKSLHNDMLVTRLERRLRRLNQRLAMLEVDVEERSDL